MPQYAMLLDTSRCIGCYTCRVACQQQNKLLPDEPFIHYERSTTGAYPHVKTEVVPVQCQHCHDAPCQRVCPTGATYTTPHGVVMVEQGRCIGCLYCMAACPYQARVRNAKKGTVDKCRYCHVLEAQGKEPASCVAACVTRARIFGDLDDPNSEISQRIAELDAKNIAPSITKTNFYFAR